jgi:hypothetical protein
MKTFPNSRFYDALKAGRFPIAVSLPRHDITLAKAARDAGADAIKLHLNAYHRASGTTFGTFAEERPFFEEVATLGLPLLVMAGQEIVPTREEMDEMVDMGVEGFNVYFAHLQPHLLASAMRPMPAMADTSSDADLDKMNELDGAIIEASITSFSDYGLPLDESDLAGYWHVVQRTPHPVIAPSQKRFAAADVSRLRSAGISGALLGVIVTSDDAQQMTRSVASIVSAARD